MDIHCIKCGEPVDNDYLHEVAEDNGKSYHENLSAFYTDGCTALEMQCNDIPNHKAAQVSSLARDLMGDDVDGIASMLEDAEYMGLM